MNDAVQIDPTIILPSKNGIDGQRNKNEYNERTQPCNDIARNRQYRQRTDTGPTPF